METTLQPARPAWEHRLHAVLALLSGEPMPQVTARFGLCRSVLYKWRHRALMALQGALTDHRPGAPCPANRLSPAEEAPLVELAQRHPTWSAAQIHAKAGPEAQSPRTIQRLRHRYELSRLPKRPAPCRPARHLTRKVKHEARRLIEAKPWLGPERLAWELQHVAHMQISPATRSCTRILRIIPEASIRGTIPPFQHEMRGRCYDSTPVFLPARADRLGVGILDALRAVAIGARCSSTDTTQASHATPQALMRPPTLYRPDL